MTRQIQKEVRIENLKKIEMDCNCGFRKLISLTVSYSKFPFCCLQHLKLGDIFVWHEADILSFTSTMQFLYFLVNKGLLLALLYIALMICLLTGLESLQLILEISTTYRLVTYLLTDNWPIWRLSACNAWFPITITSIQVPCDSVFVVIFFKTIIR